MNAQTIVDKILEDARGQAASILEDARANAVHARDEMDQKLLRQREAVRQQAKRDGREQESRMLRMAELDERKNLLASKRAMIDKAFDLALEKLRAMPKAQARAHSLKLLCSLAQGDEVLILSAPPPAWYDADFLKEANQALEQAGKQGKLTLEEGPVSGGFVLRRGGLELNCSDVALLKTQRMALEGAVAGILFP